MKNIHKGRLYFVIQLASRVKQHAEDAQVIGTPISSAPHNIVWFINDQHETASCVGTRSSVVEAPDGQEMGSSTPLRIHLLLAFNI